MRIAVTGKQGQVVQSLNERAARSGHVIVNVARPELDLAGEADAIIGALDATRPDLIVSAAAYTAVDRAEEERALAFAINRDGAAAVATAARRLGVPLIHLSTDYVFDGTKSEPYVESDATRPTGVYGDSKLAGERAIRAVHDNAAVLRTAWVYSPFGANFVKTMLRLAGEREEIGVVADQVGNPTSALDIADGILAVAENLLSDSSTDKRGVFHMTGRGEASWASFAEAIFEASANMGGPSARVRPLATADFPTTARRPANSRLSNDRLAEIHGVRLPNWQDSLITTVARLGSNVARSQEGTA